MVHTGSFPSRPLHEAEANAKFDVRTLGGEGGDMAFGNSIASAGASSKKPVVHL